jgi:phospholipid/cholesterol/gamma-HCH transport system ATP-binding protein
VRVERLTGPVGQPIIRDIELRVGGGQTLVVLGAIHSGKSLIMRHMLGLERAESGRIAIGDVECDLTRATAAELRALRTQVGVLFESSALLRHVTVIENVELPMLEHGDVAPTEARAFAHALLEDVDVTADEDSVPGELDRATRRHVALARAMALSPVALFLDEPTAGLDASAAHEFDLVVDKLQRERGLGVVIFTRDARHAFRPAAEVCVIDDGSIVARGDRDTLLASENPAVRRLVHRRGRE